MINYFYNDLIYHNISSLMFVLINILVHFVCIRFFLLRYFISIILGFIIGLTFQISYEVSFVIVHKNYFFYSINNILIYFLFSFFYFAILSTSKTSIRLRILYEIEKNNGILTSSDLIEKYNSKEIINIRIKRMIQNKQIISRNGRLFSIFSITLIIGVILDFIKLILFGTQKSNFFKYYKIK